MFLFGIPELEHLFHPEEKSKAAGPAPAPAEAPNPFFRFFGKLMGDYSPSPHGAVGPDGKPIDVDYAQHWVDATAKKQPLPPNTPAVAAEVHDAPTGSQKHADDDEMVIEKTQKGSSTTIDATGGTHTRTTTTSTTTGDHSESDTKARLANVSANGVKLGGTNTHEVKDADSSTKSTRGGHLEVGASHIELGGVRSTEATDGDATVKRDRDASVSVGNGEIGVKLGKKDHTVVKDVETDEHGQPKEVVRTQGTASQVGGGIGTDHASANASSTNTHADGKSSTTSGGASANWETGQMSANAGHSVTDPSGKTTSVTGGGGVDLGANGIQGVDVNAGVTKGKMSFSVKGGIKVEVSEPKQVGAGWLVTWKRTRTAGGGVGAGGDKAKIGVSGSVSDFEVGSRTFPNEGAAKVFHDQHDSIFADTGPAATTLDGAFALTIGESRGHGAATSKGVEGSASFEGASIGGGLSSTDANQIEVRRASLNVFEVTASDATGSAKNLSMGGLGVTAKAGKSEGEHHLTTVRFDLSTAAGKAAFEEYCRTRKVPDKGGQVVATEAGKEKGHFDGLSMGPLGESTFKGRSWENTRTDEKGKHEEYGGEGGEDFSYTKLGHWLGGKDQHKNYQLLGKQENDVEQGYVIEGTFSGESAISNLDGIYRMTGRDSPTRNRDDIKDDMASGVWKVSAEMPKERVDRYCDYIASNAHEFDYGAISDLQKSLRGAKSNDDKMRAITAFIADEGHKGMKAIGAQEQSFDVELADSKGKTNPDFPGRAGRVELTSKVEKYDALLTASAKNGPMMVGNLQQEIAALVERREHVSDPKRYQDLPDEMRAEELAKIDAYIGQFTGMRDRAAIEAVKIHGGEDLVGILDRQDADAKHKGERPKDPVQGQLYDLRDEISIVQLELARVRHESEVAIAATDHMVKGRWREGSLGKYYRANTEENHQGNEIEKARVAGDKALNELRMQFLGALDKPQTALQLGAALRDKLDAQVSMAQSANEHYREAARAMRGMKQFNGDKQDAKFWDELAEEDEARKAKEAEIQMPAMDLRKQPARGHG